MKVGIEAIGVAIPRAYVELTELAQARGIAPEKFTEGLGTLRMAVPDLDEDTVTLAARAAQMALEQGNVSASEIGMLAVGTETAVDHSKPVASYVQGLLGVGARCRVFETKHACYGGTAALQMALDWIRSGSARGKKALVICSDIARYGLATPGEPTQGAGAVAMVVSDTPHIVELENEPSGVYARDVHDFWRPLYSKDAIVDGHYSVKCYLETLEGAYRAYRESASGSDSALFSDRFSALVYHVPYGKMAKKAHRHLRTLDGDATPDASFEALAGASLLLPSQIGNTYTAAMYFGLASLLAARKGEDLKGKRVGLFSYGSGMCGEFFSGVIQRDAQARLAALDLFGILERRVRLGIADYESLMREREAIDTRAAGEPTGPGMRFMGVRDHQRIYSR